MNNLDKKPELIKIMQIRVDEKLFNSAKEKAEKTGLSVSQVVRKLLDDYVNNPQIKLNF